LGFYSEGLRRVVSAAAAIAVCVVAAVLVGEALGLLTRAYRLEQVYRRESPIASPEPARAWPVEARVEPYAAIRPRPVAAPLAHPGPRMRRPMAASAVMAADFPYRRTVLRAAARHSVDPTLVLAIIASESRGDPEAVSPSGAIGLMQLMPATAVELGVDPWKPEENIEGAVRYLSQLLEEFKSVDLSLVAYNAGPGFADRYRQGEVDLGAETRAFIMRVAGLQ
jgi:soluble lytic murein transglycosylase-like protein